jgi:2-C-methyl-D-erythritol 2,4-cyclodiphosphate synthase
MRIGLGYDVHRLVEGRPLIIGGVTIPFDKGVLGHSDGDVLIHAICDALLGAAGLGDIGQHFPDSKPQYKDANSVTFLGVIRDLLKKNHLTIENIDSVVIMEQPKLAPHRPAMVEIIAQALEISPKKINVKATTEEGMSFTGSGEGVAAQAIALLKEV